MAAKIKYFSADATGNHQIVQLPRESAKVDVQLDKNGAPNQKFYIYSSDNTSYIPVGSASGWTDFFVPISGTDTGSFSLSPVKNGYGTVYAAATGAQQPWQDGTKIISIAVLSIAPAVSLRDYGKNISGIGMGVPIHFAVNAPDFDPDNPVYSVIANSGQLSLSAGISALPTTQNVSPGPGSFSTLAPPSNRLLIDCVGPANTDRNLVPPPDDAGRPGVWPYVLNFTTDRFITFSVNLGNMQSGDSAILSLYPCVVIAGCSPTAFQIAIDVI